MNLKTFYIYLHTLQISNFYGQILELHVKVGISQSNFPTFDGKNGKTFIWLST